MKTLQHGFHINFGNSNTTLLFEGQQDQLIPSTSQILVESDLFLMAGRMMGHSFIHGGPCLSGLCPAVTHVLLGGSMDTATIQLEDIADLDIRQTVGLLDGESQLSESDRQDVTALALTRDLPGVTVDNRKWLFYRMLQMAVSGRTMRQIKQIRKGLKETEVFQLLTGRADVVPMMFPRLSATACSAKTALDHIEWPLELLSDDEGEYSMTVKSQVAEYLRQFIENASPTRLRQLVTSGPSTCYLTLRLPGHHESYVDSAAQLEQCIATIGLI
ncbi:hypothetical protein CgunFtcFv8_007705 [Champsocephalus gunnari]|uniref:Uncharacterized protein n=1 Tax=Champsocephalus gunnari TaxID=52237 RepID=A0AAN8H696_CHAGU|nr:hypothetical protein CgunFtcFv8_007705 [Champsocephalus gunnari]